MIDVQKAQYTAAENNVKCYLEQFGGFQQCNLDTLLDMEMTKLHMIDLGIVISLARVLPEQLLPRLVHVVIVRDADDLDEVQRVFKALDFSVGEQASALYVPSVLISGQKSLDKWRKNSRFS